MTTALKNALLDAYLRGVAYSLGTITKVSVHTADPGTTGANEVVGGSYARQNVAFAAAASGAGASNVAATFAGMPAVTVTHIGLWAGTTFLQGGALAASKTLNNGDTFQLSSGQITASLT